MTDKQPLWQVACRAWWSLVDTEAPTCPPEQDQWAAVLRAIADVVAPGGEMPGSNASEFKQGYLAAVHDVRQRLLDEADRAEAGG